MRVVQVLEVLRVDFSEMHLQFEDFIDLVSKGFCRLLLLSPVAQYRC